MYAALMTNNYCKRGYFRWGKISRKHWQDFSRGGNFQDTTPISFIKAYGFYFYMGVIFAKKTKAQKNTKITLTRKFPHLQYTKSLFNLIVYTAPTRPILFKTLEFFINSMR